MGAGSGPLREPAVSESPEQIQQNGAEVAGVLPRKSQTRSVQFRMRQPGHGETVKQDMPEMLHEGLDVAKGEFRRTSPGGGVGSSAGEIAGGARSWHQAWAPPAECHGAACSTPSPMAGGGAHGPGATTGAALASAWAMKQQGWSRIAANQRVRWACSRPSVGQRPQLIPTRSGWPEATLNNSTRSDRWKYNPHSLVCFSFQASWDLGRAWLDDLFGHIGEIIGSVRRLGLTAYSGAHALLSQRRWSY